MAIGLAEMESYVVDVTQSNVDALRHSYGLPGPNRLRETPVYTLFPAGSTMTRCGGVALSRPVVGQVYRWPSVRLRDLRQRRCALPTVTAVYGEAVRALAGWEAEVLLTIGTGAYPDVVGTPPSNVRIERWVDQNQVFVHSALDHGRVGPKLVVCSRLTSGGLPAIRFQQGFRDEPGTSET